MPPRVVVLGATGFTGRLVAAALVERGCRPALAGRDRTRLTALAGDLGGLDVAVADVGRPATLRGLVDAGDVLVSTVGPFERYGAPVAEAALTAGAHYLDSTGEAPWIRRVFTELGPRADGSALLPAFGYDFVPGNLAGALALEAAPAAAAVDVGYFLTGPTRPGGISSGTLASALGLVGSRAHALRGGRLVLEPPGRHVRRFAVAGGTRWAVSVGGTEPYALPRIAPQLADVGTYLGWFGPGTPAARAVLRGAAALGRLPGVRPALSRATRPLTRRTGVGPGPEQRARRGSRVVARCFTLPGAELARVELAGVDPYDFTGRVLAWAAEQVAAGRLRGTGALGPVDAFGLAELTAGCAEAGLARV